nr:ParB/RepB/Spo0J family partition protein [Brevibacterium album]
MAEKRRGLGRGLGSLIPNPESGRPSDVFFSRGERGEEAESAGSPQTRSADPAEAMRRAQASRKTTGTRRAQASKQDSASAHGEGSQSAGLRNAERDASDDGAAPAAEAAGTASGRKTEVTSSRSTRNTKKSTGKATGSARSADGAAGKGGRASSGRSTAAKADGGGESAAEVGANETTAGSAPARSGAASAAVLAAADSASTASRAAADPADGRTVEENSESDRVSRETDSAEELVPVPGTTFGELPIELIRPNPRQPREVFDEDALEELVTSIREIGVLQPVVVRRRGDDPSKYELIMGERRFRASQEAGRTTIPAIVRATTDDDLLRDALLENLHRVDLNPLEEAAAYAQLLEDFACTQEELSARIGRSRPQISNTIRLLRLPPMVQRRVAAGVLSSGHARAILGLSDPANMEVLAQRVVAEGLSVRATEEAVVLLNRGEKPAASRAVKEKDPALDELARNIGDRLETRVNVTMGKRKGKLSVEFANQEDLQRILALLGISQ